MPIRYMGTKRQIVSRVRKLVTEVQPEGRIVDLFSGMGSVTEGLANFRSVVTNDALHFTAALARARFVRERRQYKPRQVLELLRKPFDEHSNTLGKRFAVRLGQENAALNMGTKKALAAYMENAKHVANSASVAASARAAAKVNSADRYVLVTRYFAVGYFGLRQAIDLDALRFAIDSVEALGEERDWLISSWLSAAATLINAPGHTAQYLKPNSRDMANRICRYWRRCVWSEFEQRLRSIELVGHLRWRRHNQSFVSDALALLRSGDLDEVGLIYADPPYTRDQYSRYYHVYETLYHYDFPSALGEGRARAEQERFSTGFSRKSQVKQSFVELFDSIATLAVPLVLSYPSAGLLADAGDNVVELLKPRFNIVRRQSFDMKHSTMGASNGTRNKVATENIYVCQPR